MTDDLTELITDDDAALISNGSENYTEDDIKTLEWNEHIRERPGMYIGNLGDGSYSDDGIYVLIKEVLDNSVDEFMMGFGKTITVDVDDATVTIRDNGRGIPLGKLVEASSRMNTGGKYDGKAFKKSVGLNGVGIKAVNALSSRMEITSVRDGKKKTVVYSGGNILDETPIEDTDEPSGTTVTFTPDASIFRNYRFRLEFIVPLVKKYTYLNSGMVIMLNGERFSSRNGLLDLLRDSITMDQLYEPIHLKGDDIEIAFTHTDQRGEEYHTFVNGQNTTQGGTHLAAFKEAVARTLKDFFDRNFEPGDIRNGIVAAVSIKVEAPIFESQTKTKLTSRDMEPDGPTVNKFVNDFIKKELDNYLHRNLEVAQVILKKVQDSEKERKSLAVVTKVAREKAKKVNLHNKKLLDCQVHLNDPKGSEDLKLESSIFITEGDSAAGSISKIRNVATQAVFALKGKPKNSYGVPEKILYENDEFNLLQAALNIEEGIDGLRYNKVIIATDADVDGMHIRLLLLTFFLQYFPEMIKKGHLYVLQTPLFRVRNRKTSKRGSKNSKDSKESKKSKESKDSTDSKEEAPKDTYYCYSDEERINAINLLGANAEITRFKGLGEISPDEFKGFIGPEIRLDRVQLRKDDAVARLLEFYMGKNTLERQGFIIKNLVVEDDSEIS